MIHETEFRFDIDPILEQFSMMPDFGKRLTLNETNGNLLTGRYTVKPEYQGTPLGDVLKALDDIGEARLLKLESAECYTAHCDPDDRYDMVITTNPHCYLIDIEKQKMHQLPVDGRIWRLDTSIRHTAVNFGSRDRVYLNIRHRLPLFESPGYHLRFSGGDFDWKQVLYEDTMKMLNTKIKSKEITGIEKINDLEIRLNCSRDTIDYIKTNAESKGFTIEINFLG